MANILGRFAIAREQSYFKREQEADIQNYILRLKKEGIIQQDTGNRSPPSNVSLNKSLQEYEVLVEIMQQDTRLNIPRAALLKEYEKRIKAKLPLLTEEEFKNWKRKVGLNDMLSMTSKINLSRHHYYNFNNSKIKSKEVASAAVSEVAQREMMIALRSGLYSLVLASVVITSLGTFTCYYYSISNLNDVKDRIKSFTIPFGNSLIKYLKPYTTWARTKTEKWQIKTNETDVKYETEFSRSLKDRFRSKY